jgi:hypothetical protein
LCLPSITTSFLNIEVNPRSNSLLYSVKVWLTSAVVGPLIYFGSSNMLNCYDYEFLGDGFLKFLTGPYLFIILFGALLSSLTWAIFYFLIRMVLIEMFPGAKHIRYAIAFVGISLTFATFLMMPFITQFTLDAICFTGSYAFCIGLGAIFFELTIDYKL